MNVKAQVPALGEPGMRGIGWGETGPPLWLSTVQGDSVGSWDLGGNNQKEETGGSKQKDVL